MTARELIAELRGRATAGIPRQQMNDLLDGYEAALDAIATGDDAFRTGVEAARREGFERGAQWSIMDQAFRSGKHISIVTKDGPVPPYEHEAKVHEMLADLFVPKPKAEF